jgi:hypothetical protein
MLQNENVCVDSCFMIVDNSSMIAFDHPDFDSLLEKLQQDRSFSHNTRDTHINMNCNKNNLNMNSH